MHSGRLIDTRGKTSYWLFGCWWWVAIPESLFAFSFLFFTPPLPTLSNVNCCCSLSLPSLPSHSFLMSSSLPRGNSKIDSGFYPDTMCLPIVDLWRGRGMTSLLRLLFVQGIRGGYDQLVGVLRMKRDFRAISPILQFPSFTSPLSNSALPLRGYVLYKYIE